jgi:deoxycytidine triphosphate deaminase
MRVNPQLLLEKQIVKAATGCPALTSDQLQQNGIDLRLAKAERIVGNLALYANGTTHKPDLVDMQTTNNTYLFRAGEQYSLTFMEDVEIPSGMGALIIHRSTINRFAGTILSGHMDSGYNSKGGCGATFRPSSDTTIEIGARVAQIIFDEAEAASLYNGQYQDSKEKVDLSK